MSVKSSTGLEENVASALCYALGWLSGLVFFFIEKDNKTVRFHALQSIITFGTLHLIFWVIGLLSGIILRAVIRSAGYYAFGYVVFSGLFTLLSIVIGLAIFICWAILIYKTYNGQKIKLPIAGKIAAKHTGEEISM
ncbi:MAG: hypothetical protein FH749_13255 [Firmicutes bacterium]|nr:hypothetical protein [Bacillota bacterium]